MKNPFKLGIFSEQAISQSPVYKCDLTRHFKIWFTQNPDDPLGLINELRILNFLKLNPHAVLFVIVDESLCSPLGLQRLKKLNRSFSKQCVGGVSRVCFIDLSIIKASCESELDKALFYYAEQEIKHQYPGWPGIASDIIRLLDPVLSHLGVYSDFDIELRLGSTKSTFLPSNFLLSSTITRWNPFEISLNNDVVIFIDPKNNPVLLRLKELILRNLKSELNHRSGDVNGNRCQIYNRSEFNSIGVNCTVLDYVTNTSGPAVYAALLVALYVGDRKINTFDSVEISKIIYARHSVWSIFPAGAIRNDTELSRATGFRVQSQASASDLSWIPTAALPMSLFMPGDEKLIADLKLVRGCQAEFEDRARAAVACLSKWWKKRSLFKLAAPQASLAPSVAPSGKL